MTKRMLVDATHPEETRVAIVESHRDYNRLEDFDFGIASKPILRGNIYLAKVMRIEPSLQAAFVEYGGNRHGFLPFSEIHPDYFRIPMADRDEESLVDDEPEELEDEEVDDEFTEDEEFGNESENGDESNNESNEIASDEMAIKSFAPLGDDEEDDEDAIGLITDFGNAAIDDNGLTEVAMPVSPPENVGGDTQERFVR
ncbi:MAG: S1 RNA-binding domain-containing protein, partial [Bdellovibrionales bacterium]